MESQCIIGNIRSISLESDKFLDGKIKEENLPILRSHIPLFYILPFENDKILFSELAKTWNISKSSLSDIISKYEGLGMVKKICCKDDKRTVYLSLTSEAKNIKDKLDSFEQEFLDRLFGKFSDIEKKNFKNYIQKALNNWNEFL